MRTTAKKKLSTTLPEGVAKPSGFPIEIASSVARVSESHDLVQGLLGMAGASVIYGPSNCGKSFWGLDLACDLANGDPFRGSLETEQSSVIYIALEGSTGVRNRLEALRRAGRIAQQTPLYLCFSTVSLLRESDAEGIIKSAEYVAEESKHPCRLIVIDTLARAMAGGDENKGQDMTSAIKSIDMIRGQTGAHVCLIHHCGKDEAKGARGHSSLRAAVDTEIEITKPPGSNISTVRVTKQRDMPAGEAMPFSLKQIELGIDRRGNPITSCTVHHEDSTMAETRGKPGRKVSVPDTELIALLPQPTTTAWQKAALEELGVSHSAFHRALRERVRGKLAKKEPSGSWVKYACSETISK